MLDQVSETSPLKDLLGTCACRLVISNAAHRLLKAQGMCSANVVDQRRFPRYAMQGWAMLECQPTFPGFTRSTEAHTVLLVNVSRGGLAFFHSEQLYSRERLCVTMPDGTPRFVSVARCQWLGPSCYLVGCEFQGKT